MIEWQRTKMVQRTSRAIKKELQFLNIYTPPGCMHDFLPNNADEGERVRECGQS